MPSVYAVADCILCIDYLSATELPAFIRSSTNDVTSGMNFRKATVLSITDLKDAQCRLDKRLIEAEKTLKAQEEKQRDEQDEGTVEFQKAQ